MANESLIVAAFDRRQDDQDMNLPQLYQKSNSQTVFFLLPIALARSRVWSSKKALDLIAQHQLSLILWGRSGLCIELGKLGIHKGHHQVRKL